MKKTNLIWLLVAVMMMAACGTSRVVPVTGRKQKVVSDNAGLLTESFSAYKNYVSTAKLSTDATKTALVKKVGQRLATAVETYLRNNGYQNEVQNYNWEFNLVADKQVNAFCMPGGKIVVYEGLLPVTQTETSLAIVMGHEIAHAVAYHSAEQQQTQNKQQIIGQIAGSVLSASGMGYNTASTLSTLYGLGSQMASLKYSRNHETEADRIGLVFAAMAGYDPNEAITFWQRMAANSSGGSQASWLSTHPSDAQRIADIKKFLPEALRYYKPATTATSVPAKSSAKKGTTKKGSAKKATTPKTTKTIRIQ